MNKTFTRCVAVFLVPALLANPTLAAGFSVDTPAPLSAPSHLALFEHQAITPFLTFSPNRIYRRLTALIQRRQWMAFENDRAELGRGHVTSPDGGETSAREVGGRNGRETQVRGSQGNRPELDERQKQKDKGKEHYVNGRRDHNWRRTLPSKLKNLFQEVQLAFGLPLIAFGGGFLGSGHGLQIRQNVIKNHPNLFGDKTVNGKPLNVEATLASFAKTFIPEFDQVLRVEQTRRKTDLEKVKAGVKAIDLHPFLAPELIVHDPDDGEKSVKLIRKGLFDHFLSLKTADAWSLNDPDEGVPPVPASVFQEGSELTGPAKGGMLANAINTGAYGVVAYMPDFEDAGPQEEQQEEVFEQHENLANFLAGKYDPVEVSPGSWKGPALHDSRKNKDYFITIPKEKQPVLFARMPGLNLRSKAFYLGNRELPSFLTNLIIYTLNNHDNLNLRQGGPFFYIPKIESLEGALLVGRVFKALEETVGLPRGTLKFKMLNERGEYALAQEAIMWILRKNLIGPNVGRWDYGNSRQEMFGDYPDMIFPDFAQYSMLEDSNMEYTTRDFDLAIFATRTIKDPENITGFPIGGMAAQMENPPLKGDPENIVAEKIKNSQLATHAIEVDKMREKQAGLREFDDAQSGKTILIDGLPQSWVATVTEGYARASARPLQTKLNTAGTIAERLAPLQSLTDSLLTPAEKAKFQALGLLDPKGNIRPRKFIVKDGEIFVQKILPDGSIKEYGYWSDEAWRALFDRPKGTRTAKGVFWEIHMGSEFIYQALDGRNAATVDDPNTGNSWDGILADFFTGIRVMSDHATDEGGARTPLNSVRHGQILDEGWAELGIPSGAPVTADLFIKLWEEKARRGRSVLLVKEHKGAKVDYDRLNLAMEIFKRLVVAQDKDGKWIPQPVRLKYYSRVIFSVTNKPKALQYQILDAIFSPNRETVEAKIHSGAWDVEALKAYDYVHDVFPDDGGLSYLTPAQRADLHHEGGFIPEEEAQSAEAPKTPKRVTIHLNSALKTLTNGQTKFDVLAATLGESVQSLIRQFPELEKHLFKDGKPRDGATFLVNAIDHTNNLSEPLSDGDEIDIPPTGGFGSPTREEDRIAERDGNIAAAKDMITNFSEDSRRGAETDDEAQNVVIHIPAPYRDEVGRAREVALKAMSVRDAVMELIRRYPAMEKHLLDSGKISPSLVLIINAKPIQAGKHETMELEPGDHIIIPHPFAEGLASERFPSETSSKGATSFVHEPVSMDRDLQSRIDAMKEPENFAARADAIRKEWKENPRWEGIEMGFSAEAVVRLQGLKKMVYTAALNGAQNFWNIIKKLSHGVVFGITRGIKAQMLVLAGILVIYYGGWNAAAMTNTAHTQFTDQSRYPSNTGPVNVGEMNSYMEDLDTRNPESFFGKRAAKPSWWQGSKWIIPIVADIEAGFGGILNVYDTAIAHIKAGAAALHLEDQNAIWKKCGHMLGKVLDPTSFVIQKFIAMRLASAVLGVPTVIIGRTDADGARVVTSDADPYDDQMMVRHPIRAGQEFNGHLIKENDRGYLYTEEDGVLQFVLGDKNEILSADMDGNVYFDDKGTLKTYKYEKTPVILNTSNQVGLLAEPHLLLVPQKLWQPQKGLTPFFMTHNGRLKDETNMFVKKVGTWAAIHRALAYAPYVDMLWFETKTPDLEQARLFAEEVHKRFPGKKLAYNLSGNFDWTKHFKTAEEAQIFTEELAKLGYVFQFNTTGEFWLESAGTLIYALLFKMFGMKAFFMLQKFVKWAEKTFHFKFLPQEWATVKVADDITVTVTGATHLAALGDEKTGAKATEAQFDEKAKTEKVGRLNLAGSTATELHELRDLTAGLVRQWGLDYAIDMRSPEAIETSLRRLSYPFLANTNLGEKYTYDAYMGKILAAMAGLPKDSPFKAFMLGRLLLSALQMNDAEKAVTLDRTLGETLEGANPKDSRTIWAQAHRLIYYAVTDQKPAYETLIEKVIQATSELNGNDAPWAYIPIIVATALADDRPRYDAVTATADPVIKKMITHASWGWSWRSFAAAVIKDSTNFTTFSKMSRDRIAKLAASDVNEATMARGILLLAEARWEESGPKVNPKPNPGSHNAFALPALAISAYVYFQGTPWAAWLAPAVIAAFIVSIFFAYKGFPRLLHFKSLSKAQIEGQLRAATAA